MSVKRKVILKETHSKSVDSAKNFNKRRDRDFTVSSKISNQIDDTCNKLRSSSLGQPMSASLLDLQNKSFNINDLVTNSVNIVKGISSSGIDDYNNALFKGYI